MATLARAIAIAADAHEGQTDKAGAPYVLHPLRLMQRFDDAEARTVAVLHDVVEDTPWTLEALRAEGFDEAVLAALDALTRRDGEGWETFIERVAADPLATRVKRADLEDNMDLRRLATLGERDLERLQRYHRAWLRLQGAP